MIFRARPPSSPLRQFIDQFWYYDDLESPHSMERVIPDGTCELIINLSAAPRKLFDRRDHSRFTDFHRGWISGAHTSFIVIDALPRTSLMGVHFKPGGLAPFVAMRAGEFADSVVEFDAVWGARAIELRDALLEQPTPEVKFCLLEEFLLRLARGQLAQDRAVSYALARLEKESHASAISDVARELGMSHKHFIDRFRAAVGTTPKRFCRIRRFQDVLRRITSEQTIEWVEIAHAGGFYDQAHFVHEFHAFAGLNPSTYLRQSGEYMNFVPVC